MECIEDWVCISSIKDLKKPTEKNTKMEKNVALFT